MKKKSQKADPKPYEPSPHEQAAVAAYLAERKERPPAPRVTVANKDDGLNQVGVDHPEPVIGGLLLMEALGTKDYDFCRGLLNQLVNIGTQGKKVDARDLNFVLSIVKGIAPADEVEAMLAAQMAAVHLATMTFARRLAHVENISQQDSAERAFNKLARTFAAQVEALKRYRGKAEQQVTVKHVHVHAGGQAVVGTIEAPGGGGAGKSEDQPHAKQIAYAPQPAVWSADKEREPVPITRDAERPLPAARRPVVGCAEGQ